MLKKSGWLTFLAISPAASGVYRTQKNGRDNLLYQCVLCGARMVFSSVEVGSRAEGLLAQRRQQLEKKRWLLAA